MGSAWALWRRDILVWSGVGIVLAAAALGPIAQTEDQAFYLEVGADLLLIGLILVALLRGLQQLPTRDERRFWAQIAIGFSMWALALSLYLVIPEAWWSHRVHLIVDSLFLVFYLMLLLAIDSRPDLRLERRIFAIGGHYRWPGTIIFSVGLFLYFVVVTAVLSPERYESLSPSLLLYLTLDLYLLVRLLILSRVARPARWKRWFGLTAILVVGSLLSDFFELLVKVQVIPEEPLMPWAALWLLPSLGMVAVIRLRALPVAAETEQPSKSGWASIDTLTPGAPFLLYAFFLPLVHFAAYRLGLFDEPTRTVHESLVLIWLLCLGIVSLIQYLDLEREHRSLLDERRLTEERLWRLANFDQLTGLPNRILFRDRLVHALKQARRGRQLVAIVFADLDGFKRVNDSHGHAAGDELLRRVAQRMTDSVRDSDTVARLGGDEFTVILEAIQDTADVEWLAQRIHASLSEPFQIGEHTIRLGCSLGIGVYPQDGEDIDALLASADAAMYKSKRAKASGHHQVPVFSQTRLA